VAAHVDDHRLAATVMIKAISAGTRADPTGARLA
jgi:hypothetical protein